MVESKVFTKIYNNSNYLLKELPNHHPESIKYRNFWKTQVVRIFDGCWIPDTKEININLEEPLNYTELSSKINHSWRWIPPQLYFYINFGTILHKPEDAPKTSPKQKIRPYLSDFEVAFFYNWIEARGFSGFEDDDEFSCNRDIPRYNSSEITESQLHKTCFRKDGSVKTYIPAREYLRRLTDKPLGYAIYENEAKNLILVATRRGGKSWSTAVGVALHEIITDGMKYFDSSKLKNPPLNEVFIGSGMASKSSEICQKVQIAMENIPGVWHKGLPDEVPSPLYKHMAGTLQPNNIKNPWRHEYQKKVAGEWKNFGSGSNIKHGVFTSENPEVTAGGSYSVIVIEEVGLTQNLLIALGSSEATQVVDGTSKFGSTLMIGTGGSVEKVVETEIVFRDPAGFNCLEFDDEWENTGKIGWFVPAYYMDRSYKDSEGNTIISKAYEHYEKRRAIKKKSRTGSALDLELMNFPLIPSEMFLNKGTNDYPIADLKHRLAELMTNDKYLDSTYKGKFYIDESGDIKWVNENTLPIREFPLRNDSIEGCVEMFYIPQRSEDGSIPYGRYIASLDSTDDDGNEDNFHSLQSFFIYDLWTEKIVLEYSARTKFAKDFYEQCRRGLLYYNARLLYENQKKGVFTYFDTKNSLYLLEDTPPELRDMDMQRGSTVGNKGKGIYATPAINKWGREQLGPAWMNSQAINKDSGVNNVNTLLSVGLIKEAIFYSPTINADRIASFGILMIFREIKLKYKPEKEAKTKASYNNDKFFERTYGYKKQKNTIFN